MIGMFNVDKAAEHGTITADCIVIACRIPS